MHRIQPSLREHGARPGSFPASIAILCGVLGLGACTGTPRREPDRATSRAPADPRAAAGEILQSAAAAMVEGNPEAALNRLDASASWRASLPAALRGKLDLAFGEANLAFARQERKKAQRTTRGSGGVDIEGCYVDAERSLARAATDLAESAKPLIALANVYKDQGKFDDAVAAATRAVQRVTAKADARKDALVEPLLLRAETRLPALAALRRAEQGEPEESTRRVATKILADIALAMKLDDRVPAAYELAATTYRWLGRKQEAMRVLEDGIRANPGHAQHHVTLQALFAETGSQLECVGLYRRLAKEIKPESADVTWFLGRAYYALADASRGKGDRKAADSRYDAASAAYAHCAELNPSYQASTDVWRALAAVSKARLAIDEGDEKTGEAELDRAWSITPDIAAVDARGYDRYYDSFKKTYRGGVYALGARFMTGGGRLEEARAFFRKITKRHPTWGPAWNNLGLASRDLGVATERGGDKAAATTLYEESYAAYKRAAKLSPDDPRIQNDVGLMCVYHLKRDYDFAVAQFEKAITLGTDQLGELPDKADDNQPDKEAVREQRRFLEEAVGDAWQNWGLVHEERGALEAAAAKYRKAVGYYPGKRRDAARRLRAIEAKLAKKGEAVLCTPGDDDVQKALDALHGNAAETALDLIEPLLETRSADAEVWLVAGRASLAFAKQRIAQGAKQGIDANLIDAVARLRKAAALARKLDGGAEHVGSLIHVEPTLYATEALLMRGQAAEAWNAGRAALRHIDTAGLDLEAAARIRLMAAVADAGARKAIADFRAGQKPASDVAAARSLLTDTVARLEKTAGDKPIDVSKLFQTWANLEEWSGHPLAAIRALGRGCGLVAAAARGPLVNAMLGIVGRRGGGSTAIEIIDGLLKATPRDATLHWYRGYAWVLYGNGLRVEGEAAKAPAAYAKGRAELEASIALNAGFEASAKHWVAASYGWEGWCAKTAGDAAEAKALWLKALKTSPAAADQRDSLGQSAKLGLLALGGEHFNAGRFAEGAALMEEMLKALGHDDFNACNNLGLFLREQGTRLPQGTARRRVLERSFAAYKRCVKLAPTHARTLNDTALIDVYYLHEHDAESEAMLRKAIDEGTGQMADDPPSDARAKRDLEEAIGDAWMNLGVLLMRKPARLEEAEKCLKKSLEFYPKRARASLRHLRRIARDKRKKSTGGGR